MPSTITATLLLGAATLFVFFITRTKKNKSVPRLGWEIGTLSLPATSYLVRSRLDRFHKEMHEKLGPIFEIPSLTGPEVYLADYEEAKRVLGGDETTFTLIPELAIICEGLIDLSLISLPTGPVWKRHRQAIQPAFGPTHLRHAAKASVDMANELGNHINKRITEASSKSCSIELYSTMNSLILEIMGIVMFSEKFGALDILDNPDMKLKVFGSPEKVRTRSAITIPNQHCNFQDFLSTLTTRILVPKNLWSLIGLEKSQPKVANVRKKYEAFMMKVVEKAKLKQAAEGGASNESENRHIGLKLNFIERMLKNTDSGSLSLEEIVSESIVMFLAGQDTTATLLAQTIASLAQNPDIQEKLYREIKDISLDDTDSPGQSAHPYLDLTIKESLRLNAGVPATQRQVIKDTTILGHEVHAGSKVFVSLNTINQSETYFKDPFIFEPERWVPGNRLWTPLMPLIPFGGGNRVCIGQKMAQVETKWALVRLLQMFKFDWDSTSKVRVVSLITTVTIGQQVIVTQR